MNTEIIIHADSFETERPFIDAEIERGLTGKLDSYLKRYDHHARSRLELWLHREKDGEFAGKVILAIDNDTFRSERENFRKLDDLISHLFTHLKEQLAKA